MSECKDAPRKELISEINQCHLEQEKYEKELLELQAQVAVLRGALERARKGFVNLIDLNLLPSEEYEKDANKIAQCCFEALSDTPAESAERVQMLVEALEEVEKMGTYKNNGTFSEDMLEEPWAVIAGNALAEWRRDK